MELEAKAAVIAQLRQQVMLMEGYARPATDTLGVPSLGIIDASFPQRKFPTGVTHEFISYSLSAAAATDGFMAMLVGSLTHRHKFCLWISSRRQLYPASLRAFGIAPEQVIFVDLKHDTEVLWALEEALRCPAVAAVVGEVQEISFAASRRFQLAVERSKVTGLLHRMNPRREHPLACVARWQIKPLASDPGEGVPGVGFPRWQVQLTRIRNGRPGIWSVEWSANGLRILSPSSLSVVMPEKRVRYG